MATPVTVSIVVNCFNGADYLRDCLASILAQSFTSWEVVFIDNCSTDESAAIARAWPGNLRIVKTERTIPLYAARNIALEAVTGEYVTFLDTDDVWAPGFLAAMVAKAREGASFVYCRYELMTASREPIASLRTRDPFSRITLWRLLLHNSIPMAGVLLRRDLIRSYRFNDGMMFLGDYDLWVRLAADDHLPVRVDAVLTFVRVHGNNISAAWRTRRITEERQLVRWLLNKCGVTPAILAYWCKRELMNLFRRTQVFLAARRAGLSQR